MIHVWFANILLIAIKILMSKTLLVTDIPPCKQFSGSLLTWHLTKTIPADQLVAIFLMNPDLLWVKPEFPHENAPNFLKMANRYERAYHPNWAPMALRPAFGFINELYRRWVHVPKLGRLVHSYAKENTVDRVWIILQGQTMNWLAEWLIRKSKLSVHVQIWDTPKWWAKAFKMDRLSRQALLKSYEFNLKNADEVGSASFNMSKILKNEMGRDSTPLLSITPAARPPVPNSSLQSEKKYIIGIAGQLYATDTIMAFIESLDEINWNLDGRTIELHYWGQTVLPVERVNIHKRDYVPQDVLLDQMAVCHALYCPYWFDPEFREEARTSFPQKLVSYIASGRPILFHGPKDSSPGTFVVEFNLAIGCFSKDHADIQKQLRQVLTGANLLSLQENGYKVIQSELSEQSAHRHFRKFMKFDGPTAVER